MSEVDKTTWVVQVQAEPALRTAWVDVATVEMPPRTQRHTVIVEAIGASSETIPDGARVRVLDARSAHAVTIAWEKQPPALRIVQ